ncbi:MAG: virulence RhuM family protein [Verrucomicrobia bacterium]|nr:virulence RhuM family protein [Verrucomicrobiota bacterium]
MSKSASQPPAPSGGEIILYQTEDGRTRLEVRFKDETVWLSLNQMADLFQRDKSVISRHIKNVFQEGELSPEATVAKSATVQTEGRKQVSRDIEFYNLDVIISVGYRVKSHRGTQFRIWATQRLREYIVKGFTMDDERLKNPPGKGQKDYFDEQLERIRDIRSSERRFYQKVLDIYATSVDYAPDEEVSQQFFATVQNKMHWAAHGQTAAEVIHARVDATKPFMGLKTTRPGGIIRKEDVSIAKNYLDADELGVLNRIVNAYLEFAELQALRRKVMTMRDWIAKLDDFLNLSAHELLNHAGRISAEQAWEKAELEYEQYRRLLDAQPRPVDLDFEKAVAKMSQSPQAKKLKPPKP